MARKPKPMTRALADLRAKAERELAKLGIKDWRKAPATGPGRVYIRFLQQQEDIEVALAAGDPEAAAFAAFGYGLDVGQLGAGAGFALYRRAQSDRARKDRAPHVKAVARFLAACVDAQSSPIIDCALCWIPTRAHLHGFLEATAPVQIAGHNVEYRPKTKILRIDGHRWIALDSFWKRHIKPLRT